jgi:hypothetical protein
VGLIVAGRKQVRNRLQDILTYGAFVGITLALVGLLVAGTISTVLALKGI